MKKVKRNKTNGGVLSFRALIAKLFSSKKGLERLIVVRSESKEGMSRLFSMLAYFEDVHLLIEYGGNPFPLILAADPQKEHVLHLYPGEKGNFTLKRDMPISIYRGPNAPVIHIYPQLKS